LLELKPNGGEPEPGWKEKEDGNGRNNQKGQGIGEVVECLP
jgi:hypothetical protein